MITALLKDTSNKWSWKKLKWLVGPVLFGSEEVILKTPKTLSLMIVSA